MVPALILVPAHYLWKMLGRPSPWPLHFLRLAARACGLRVEIVGAPLQTQVFFVANHVSWIDILALGSLTGTAFVAQDHIANWPVFGWLARLNNTVFVSRTGRMQVGKQVAALSTSILRHRKLTLFPESTTTDGSYLLPFKAPLFAALDPPPPGMHIQPVLLDFDAAGRDLAWIGTEIALANAWRVVRRQTNFSVRVHFLEPFDPASIGDCKSVSAECRRRIAAALTATLGEAVA